MPWNHEKNYGFSIKSPWIPFSKARNLLTVEDNLKNPNSIYHYTKRLIKKRKKDEVLIHGDIEFVDLDHPELFSISAIIKTKPTMYS